MSARDATLLVHIATATGVMSIFAAPQSGINIWGVNFHHTALGTVRISNGTVDIIELELAAAGSISMMFPVPLFLTVDPDVEAITATSECYVYYSLA